MKILLVWTHPVPESYNAALRDSVLEALSTLDDTEVELLDLYTSGFDPKAPEIPIEAASDPVASDPTADTTVSATAPSASEASNPSPAISLPSIPNTCLLYTSPSPRD